MEKGDEHIVQKSKKSLGLEQYYGKKSENRIFFLCELFF